MRLRLLGILSLLLCLWPHISAAAEPQQCFTETKHCIEGRFLEYWQQNGGLPVFGYPISDLREEQNRDTGERYWTQWFERARFEYHPENSAPYDVLLGRLGDDVLLLNGINWQDEVSTEDPIEGCLWFPVTRRNVCNQQNNRGFKRYWETHGLNDSQLDAYGRSLALFGNPLTAPRMETNSSGDTVLTQWFERARFEWHPDQPDEFKVLLGLLGSDIAAVGPHGASSYPSDLTALNSGVIFSADDGVHGRELWFSNGYAQGTTMIKDINPGPEFSSPFGFTPIGPSQVLFVARDAEHDMELWASDGTAAGTYLVKDIFPGAQGSWPVNITPFNNGALFFADDGAHGSELWFSDGSAAGTRLVKDIFPGAEGALPSSQPLGVTPFQLTVWGTQALFFARDSVHGVALWRTDGTAEGTQLLAQLTADSSSSTAFLNLTPVAGKGVFFSAWDSEHGFGLWLTDGTTTTLIHTFAPYPRTGIHTPPPIGEMIGLNGKLYFSAYRAEDNNTSLWVSDGTPGNTYLLASALYAANHSLFPTSFIAADDMVYFQSRDSGPDGGIYRISASGTVEQLSFYGMLAQMQPFNGRLLLLDKTTLPPDNDSSYLLRSLDPSTGALTTLHSFASGLDFAQPYVTTSNGVAYISVGTNQHGIELWRASGETGGTTLVKDINPGRE